MDISKAPKARLPWIAAILAVAAAALGIKSWHDTMGEPIVERAVVVMPSLPAGSGPIKLVLLSDIHIAGPDMPPERLVRIVSQINALKPDLVLIAGDMVSEKRFATHIYSAREAVAPLGKLEAPLGVIAVPGNHDHWFDLPALAAEMSRQRIRLLINDAINAGPLVIGGLDDDYTGRADVGKTIAAMRQLEGAPLILSHSPDPTPDLPQDIGLVLAGHTHCGQIAYPWGGAPATLSRYGSRFGCGRSVEGERIIIVGAGLGTSLIPLRLFTQPTLWQIELRPPEH